MIIASCGHEISLEWHEDEKSSVEYFDTEEGKEIKTYAVLCEKCRNIYEKKNLICTKPISE